MSEGLWEGGQSPGGARGRTEARWGRINSHWEPVHQDAIRGIDGGTQSIKSMPCVWGLRATIQPVHPTAKAYSLQCALSEQGAGRRPHLASCARGQAATPRLARAHERTHQIILHACKQLVSGSPGRPSFFAAAPRAARAHNLARARAARGCRPAGQARARRPRRLEDSRSSSRRVTHGAPAALRHRCWLLSSRRRPRSRHRHHSCRSRGHHLFVQESC